MPTSPQHELSEGVVTDEPPLDIDFSDLIPAAPPPAEAEPVPEPSWWRAILRRIGAALGVEQDKSS